MVCDTHTLIVGKFMVPSKTGLVLVGQVDVMVDGFIQNRNNLISLSTRHFNFQFPFSCFFFFINFFFILFNIVLKLDELVIMNALFSKGKAVSFQVFFVSKPGYKTETQSTVVLDGVTMLSADVLWRRKQYFLVGLSPFSKSQALINPK